MKRSFLLLATTLLSLLTLSPSLGQVLREDTFPLQTLQYKQRKGPPTDKPEEGTQTNGGTRGDCLPAGSQLAALTPIEQEMYEIAPDVWIPNRTFVWGDSVSASPTLWFHLTQPLPQETLTVEIQTKAKQSIYRKQILLSETPGLVAVPLLDNSLQDVQGRYRWTAEIVVDCTENPSKPYSETLKVEGWIHRVSEPVIDAGKSPAQAAVEYAAAGAWFDTLALLIEMYQADPNNADVQAAWAHLMSEIDLEIPVTAIPVP